MILNIFLLFYGKLLVLFLFQGPIVLIQLGNAVFEQFNARPDIAFVSHFNDLMDVPGRY